MKKGNQEISVTGSQFSIVGTEVGLWVAFAILITLVLIALILAAYLYRK